MSKLEFSCLPTIIGSMPHVDPGVACREINRFLKDIPAWPQLPRRSFLESMHVQFSQGFPGVAVGNDKILVDRSRDLNKPLEVLYAAYLNNNVDQFPISPEYAAGLYVFLSLSDLSPIAVKGQVTGPITWGLTVSDSSGKAVIYDEVLGDAISKLLRLKAGWQEKQLRRLSPNTIIFVDEPYLQAYGSSSFISLTREKIIGQLEEVFGGIRGLKGVHCCGNTDWSVLLATSTDILSFDTYNYAQSLSLYPTEVKKFLDRGGTVAWGIIPNDADLLAKESVASLKDRLEEAMAPFTRKDVPFSQLIRQGIITPSCGLLSLSIEEAGRALELLSELSANIRRRYKP